MIIETEFWERASSFEAGTELWEPAGRGSCSGASQGKLQRAFEKGGEMCFAAVATCNV